MGGVLELRRFALGKSGSAVDQAVRMAVDIAYHGVSSFRERLDSQGLDPSDLSSCRDLSRLSPISRDALAKISRKNLLHGDVQESCCHVGPTSGTTGTPLLVYMSRAEALFRRLVLFQAIRKSAPVRIPFSIAEVGTGPAGAERERDITQRLRLSRTVRILRDRTPEDQLRELRRTRPQVVTGHPSCLETVAEEMVQQSVPASLGTRLVACRGELLTFRTRSLLERAFGCRVVDFYNCEEVGNVAWECPARAGLMHLSTDGSLVEILDDDGLPVPYGEEGNVVITNLFNLTMPIIRYRLGDRASLLKPDSEPCACGHRGPSMSLVAGRSDDFICLPSGRRISPRVVDSVVGLAAMDDRSATGFRASQYRIVQRMHEEIEVTLAMGGAEAGDLPDRIRRGFQRLSPDLRCVISVVDAFADRDGTKVRAITSHVRTSIDPVPN